MELWRLVTRYTLKRGTDGIKEARHKLHFKKRNRWNYGGLSHVTL